MDWASLEGFSRETLMLSMETKSSEGYACFRATLTAAVRESQKKSGPPEGPLVVKGTGDLNP